MIWTRGIFDVRSVLFMLVGPLFLVLGLAPILRRPAPRVRLEITDHVIHVLPDRLDWFLFWPPEKETNAVALDDLTGIDDGGVMYGYRRLRIKTDQKTYRVNTTHLDTDLRSIVALINARLAPKQKTLVEKTGVGRARTGVWTIQHIAANSG